MGYPGKVKFPIYPIILPSLATRVSSQQCSVLSTTLRGHLGVPDTVWTPDCPLKFSCCFALGPSKDTYITHSLEKCIGLRGFQAYDVRNGMLPQVLE